MAFQPLSVGDILMLSQCAWRIGRAFVQKSAPTEFARVEREANDLSNTLKLAADALHADDSILSRADEETVQAVYAILESAQKSLGDLENFVDRYQVIKKRQVTGGYIVERRWSEAVLANYKTIKWTTEGSNIEQLQDVLHMHTNTITLTMQALQTKSLSRLERTVMPMAENVASIHERVSGDLGNKIDDLHRVIMAVANSTPSLQARDRVIDGPGHRKQLSSGTESEMSFSLDAPAMGTSPPRNRSRERMGPRCDSAIVSPESPQTVRPRILLPPPQVEAGANPTESWLIDLHSDPATTQEDVRSRPATSIYSESRAPSSAGSPTSTRRGSLRTIDEYRALATQPYSAVSNDARPNSRQHSHISEPKSSEASPPDRHNRKPSDEASGRRASGDRLTSPAPASPPQQSADFRVATPKSILTTNGSSASANENMSPRTRAASNDSTQPAILFERSLFRNAATLCDARGTLVEYAKHKRDEADPRYDTEMVAVCEAARIFVIRKRENREHGGTKLATSIWVLSDDGKVRCQQKLSERAETIPYSSYFTPEKVSIAGSFTDELALRCHGVNWSDPLEEEIRTGWINYIFASATDAAAFQSAVFGRTLIGSFRTSKTTVIHEGIKGVFALEEQFAKMDTFRLFEDDGIATAGADGGVLALLHVSSTFGEGWAKFWLNSSRQHVYVKKDGERCVKMKGLQVTVPGSSPVTTGPARRPSILDEHVVRVDAARAAKKQVTGLRVEFETFREREDFLLLCRRVQERMLPLPYC